MRAGLLAILVLLLASEATAQSAEQVVYLNDGSVIRGQITQMTDQVVVVKTQFGDVTVKKDAILRIDFGGGAPQPAPQAPPQPEAPRPLPPPVRLGRRADSHTGIFLGGDLGIQNPRGNFYFNAFEPGPAMKFQIGLRVAPELSFESGFLLATGDIDVEGDISSATYFHLANLDVRYFLTGPGDVEPNLLVGWTLLSAMSYSTGPFDVSYTGYSPTLGAGFRFHSTDVLFLNIDLRYMYTRYTDFSVSDGTNSFDGSTQRQLHGDLLQVFAGIGLQF